MDSLIPVVMIFSGIVIGAVVVWLLLRAQSQRSYEKGQADSATQVAALQERLTARDQEAQKLQQSGEKEVAQREQLREERRSGTFRIVQAGRGGTFRKVQSAITRRAERQQPIIS
jgi:C4-dicarboxylate-specific signal transduction histidine kinase